MPTLSSKTRRRALIALIALVALLGACALGVRLRYGGGDVFPDRSPPPVSPAPALEVVAELPLPPGNVAVAADGRVFFTMHPDGGPKEKLVEWVGGRAVPFPDAAFQERLATPIGVRIDARAWLWLVDHGTHGLGDPKLVAIDIASRKIEVEQHLGEVAGAGSMLNDLVVRPDGKRVYIAEASVFALSPAILVYDVESQRAWRKLESDPSVMPERYFIHVDGEPMQPFGLFALRPGVDSIAIDRKGEWLYFAAMTARKLYRVRTAELEADATPHPEAFAEKTVSDGITSDDAGNVYLSDPEHGAIVRLSPEGRLETLLRDERLRWPDGFGFGPDGWLYVTCSSLQHVVMKSRSHVDAHAPYHIFRLQPGATVAAGQ
jgi:sugar lactone lactonase YvrE